MTVSAQCGRWVCYATPHSMLALMGVSGAIGIGKNYLASIDSKDIWNKLDLEEQPIAPELPDTYVRCDSHKDTKIPAAAVGLAQVLASCTGDHQKPHQLLARLCVPCMPQLTEKKDRGCVIGRGASWGGVP